MSIFCKHKWELIDKEVVEPLMYKMTKLYANQNRAVKAKIPSRIDDDVTTVIQLVQCTKCGKIQKFVTKG